MAIYKEFNGRAEYSISAPNNQWVSCILTVKPREKGLLSKETVVSHL